MEKKNQSFPSLEDMAHNLVYKLRTFPSEFEHSELLDEAKEKDITSPPEVLFYIAWKLSYIDTLIELRPQQKIKNYRVDFVLDFIHFYIDILGVMKTDAINQISHLFPKIAIEIDGHKWHEKSQDQATNDRKRERIIQGEGYKIYRFMAREVFRDAPGCVHEIARHYSNVHAEIFENIVLDGKRRKGGKR